MNTTYAHLTGRRAWYVPDVSVWGDWASAILNAVSTEADGSTSRVVFTQFSVGGTPQEIAYTSLTDHRGHQLPDTINSPVIVIIPKNSVPVTLIGRPTDVACRLARTTPHVEDGLVDLWIVEARH